MGPVPIVRIKHEPSAIYGGFVEINESDFDPEVHELFDESADPEGQPGDHKAAVKTPAKTPAKRK